jgi:ribonuclease G
MNAAFVNIGMAKAAFLFGGDVIDPLEGKRNRHSTDAISDSDDPRPPATTRPISQLVKEGQEIIVQVAKGPLGTKGPRVTTHLTIPGRFVVFLPQFSHIGISRRIESEPERVRLKALIERFLPEDSGVIVRTAAVGVQQEQLESDVLYLQTLWTAIASKVGTAPAPTLLHHDLNMVQKTTRDLYSSEIESILIDDAVAYQSLKAFLSASIPGSVDKLMLYDLEKPIFDEYGIEVDIGRALANRVNLPSGGYLIIEQTEALTTLDVNTGKFVGKVNAQDTILKTNLEAVVAITDQLKVRNIGGIIVADFIDMESHPHRELIYNRLIEELKSDRARTNVLRVSELGLVQMTRKRTTESLERQLLSPCPHCEGTGHVRSIQTETFDLIREIKRVSLQSGKKIIHARVRGEVKDWIITRENELFDLLAAQFGIEVNLIESEITLEALRQPAYEVWV